MGEAGRGWRGLGVFWAAVALLGGAGLAALQALGPPRVVPAEVGPPAPLHGTATQPAAPGPPVRQADARPAPAGNTHATAEKPADPVAAPVMETAPRQIAAPMAALLEPSRAFAPAQLPRVAADGRVSRVVYAAPVPTVPAGASRVALLVSGFGLSDRESRAAIEHLPGAVSFAVSSYGVGTGPLLTAARETGHELLASIPMEPQGYPGNDEGGHSLLTGAGQAENGGNLEWALSRTPGVVGATGASDGMRGERFADIAALFGPMVAAVTGRGLLYVDARPGRVMPDQTAAGAPVRAVDVVLDDQLGRAEIDARLQSLERTARERGSAIGLVGALRPATIERVAAWCKALDGRDLVLVPVSAVVPP